jgi:NAD(P)-dependent dehydrogenase (short-subunit alcohol dehydrogenase family)
MFLAAWLPSMLFCPYYVRQKVALFRSMTGRFPLPFSGPSSASKAAMEAFADVYRTELKPFGIDFIMVQPGFLITGGPAKTAAQLEQVSENMTVEQKNLWKIF